MTAWRRLVRRPSALLGLLIVGAVLLAALVGPLLSPYTYTQQQLDLRDSPPSARFWFGTDNLGRDLLTRALYGARISLAVGLLAGLLQLGIGVLYGATAALKGGAVDNVMMRVVDIIDTVPLTLYVIMLMVVLGHGLGVIFLAMGLVYWTSMARLVRAQVLSLREQEFVLAARAAGAGTWRIITRHLLPNAMGPIIVTLTFSIPVAIFTESFLSFIGLGVSAPMASWGTLAAEGVSSLRSYPWQLVVPATAICLTMFGFNLLGDGLRDALDPRLMR